jgi:hypothetical protein
VPGFSLIRTKNKPTNSYENIVEISEPENHQEEQLNPIIEDQNDQPTPNIEPITENEVEPEEEQKEIAPTIEAEKSSVDEMKIISSKPKEKVTCQSCERPFGTALFMYDYSEGERKLVGCCPYCNEIIGKTSPKKAEIATTDIEKTKRLQETAKKREAMAFQINSDEFDELIKNTAYVR